MFEPKKKQSHSHKKTNNPSRSFFGFLSKKSVEEEDPLPPPTPIPSPASEKTKIPKRVAATPVAVAEPQTTSDYRSHSLEDTMEFDAPEPIVETAAEPEIETSDQDEAVSEAPLTEQLALAEEGNENTDEVVSEQTDSTEPSSEESTKELLETDLEGADK